MKSRKKNDIPEIQDLINEGTLSAFSSQGTYWCNIRIEGKSGNAFPLYSRQFIMALKLFYRNTYQCIVSSNSIKESLEELEMLAFENPLPYNLENRVACLDNGAVLYDLNADDNTSIYMNDGIAEFVETPEMTFIRSKTYANQIEPDLTIDATLFPQIMRKHIHLKDQKELLLFCIYLVTCFVGMQINHPILICYGQKGASKSTTLRRIERVVDPKNMDLCGIPKSTENLELRLNNSYMLTLDNVSYLKREVSDTLARAVTNGASPKRILYEDTEELILNLHCIVAVNGISLVAKESDLLDRSLLLNLERVNEQEMRTEKELSLEFEKDLPAILGCCFQLAAMALYDKHPIKLKRKTRMADFFDMSIKVGRAMGYTEEEISDILWLNQKKINRETLTENVVAQCLLEVMVEHTTYHNSVSGLLGDIKSVAEANYISNMLLPKQPNGLSRRLNEIKSNLEQEYGIFYEIVNVGQFKEIRLQKKKH